MTEEPETVIICMADAAPTLTGSIQLACYKCGKQVWMGPAGQVVSKERNAKPICPRCAAKVVEQDDAKVMPPTDLQVLEAIRHVRANPTLHGLTAVAYLLRSKDMTEEERMAWFKNRLRDG